MSHTLASRITIPAQACAVTDCSNCITAEMTRVIKDNFQLVTPEKFVLRPSDAPKQESWTTTEYTCATPTQRPCDCTESPCNGQTKFCEFFNCSQTEDCFCSLTNRQTTILHISADEVLTNPDLVIFQVCLLRKPGKTHRRRHLLEKETATFHNNNNNLTISFNDPVLSLPDVGRLIVRTTDYEHIIKVPDDLMVTLPFEILAFKNTIEIVYLHPKGFTVSGTIHVSGKSTCQLRQCIFCLNVFNSVQCWPTHFQYLFYCLSLITGFICIYLFKIVCGTVWWLIRALIISSIAGLRLFKATIRCALLLAFLENTERRRQGLPLTTTAVLLLCFSVVAADSICSNGAVVQSEIHKCETDGQEVKRCSLSTTAEFTLPAIRAEQCFFFHDTEDNELFSLAVKLEEVKCHFNLKREYFTFPVQPRHLSQVSCIYNKFCGRGLHCRQTVVGTQGLRFEAETPESRSFPGVSRCDTGGLGVSCLIITRPACMFHRTWYEPDLLQAYEVSSITGHSCSYHLAVTHTENNTISRITLTDSAYTSTGVKITLLGAFDQPQLHLTESFVQRVGRPQEAFLIPTSRKNFPKSGEIGSVQANSSFTKDFIFDPDISKCDFFEDTLRCHTAEDALKLLQSSKEHALPLQRNLHYLRVENDQLKSSLLLSAAVRLQLSFENYRVTVSTNNVCPTLDDKFVQTTGCYNCNILARLLVRAHSTCQAGVATVQLQQFSLHTKAIYLTTEPTTVVIKFLASTKCIKDKLCLKAGRVTQCLLLDFCLQEPSIELINLNLNYTNAASVSTSNDFFSWLHMPNFSTPLMWMKFLSALIVAVCMMVTCASMCITCCCKRH